MKSDLLASASDYFDLVRSPVLLLDPRGQIILVNEWLSLALQKSKEDLQGKDWFQTVAPQELSEKYRQDFVRRMNSNWKKVYQEDMLNHNGDTLHVQWQPHFLKDFNNHVVAVLCSGEDVTEKNLLRQQLTHQQELSRKELMDTVLAAVDLERKQLAYELHDGVNQVLTVCKLLVETEAKRNDLPALGKVAEQLQGLINDIRSISHRLHPCDSEGRALGEAVQVLVNQLNEATSISFSLKVTGNRHLGNIAAAKALHIYRILQEALVNIVKHASASEGSILLHTNARMMVLKINDNGRGFNTNSYKPGMGIRSIRSRVNSLGGKITISSAAGEGTMLHIRIPLL